MNPGGSTIEFRSESEAQTRAIAAALARGLRAGDLVALEGELGAGKTCFVRGLAEGLGLDSSQVASPTFVIVHEYERANPGPHDASDRRDLAALVHVDAYRLTGADELETIGFADIVQARDSIIAIEWPSRVEAGLPPARITVSLRATGAQERSIRIATSEAMGDRLQGLRPIGGTAAAGAPHCRSCGQPLSPEARTFPFCSERCRLADLGAWFRERYRTSREVERDDELSE